MTSMPVTDRIRFPRPRRLVGSAALLLAMLFVLLRPVCDALAAPGERDGGAMLGSQYDQAFAAGSGHHADDGICCTSVAADTLTVPAALLPTGAYLGDLALSSGVPYRTLVSPSRPPRLVARRDPAPPLPYHARSLRRLV